MKNCTLIKPDVSQLKKLDDQEVRSVLVGILEAFASFCDREGLSYYLLGGTLLGSVRHEGFIPWDDDIDVGMPRPDYMKFYEMTRNSNIDGIFKTYSHYNRKNYTFPFIRLCDTRTYLQSVEKTIFEDLGTCIDIFPIDGLPASDKGIARHYKVIRILRHISNYARYYYQPVNEVRELLAARRVIDALIWFGSYSVSKVLKNRLLLRLIDWKARMYKYENSPKIGVSVFGYGPCEANDKESFVKKEKGLFCGRTFCISADSRTYLSNLYGDFMKLPPIEKRISNHPYISYWRNPDNERD